MMDTDDEDGGGGRSSGWRAGGQVCRVSSGFQGCPCKIHPQGQESMFPYPYSFSFITLASQLMDTRE